MKANDLRILSIDDLVKRKIELQEELFRLNFKHGIRRLENTSKLSLLRKDIARIQTVLVEKQINII